MKPKNSVVLYRSKTLSDGTHPVMLQVFYDKKRKYYNTGVSGKEKEWDPERSTLENSPKLGIGIYTVPDIAKLLKIPY